MSLSVLHYSGLSLISLLDSLSGSYSTVNLSSFPETETACQSVLSLIFNTNPPSFQSIFILLHANTSLIAPQWLYTYLFSFLTQSLIYAHLCPVHIPISFTPMWTATVVTDTH